jgi:DNA-binding XRE family transcriptional regulator
MTNSSKSIPAYINKDSILQFIAKNEDVAKSLLTFALDFDNITNTQSHDQILQAIALLAKRADELGIEHLDAKQGLELLAKEVENMESPPARLPDDYYESGATNAHMETYRALISGKSWAKNKEGWPGREISATSKNLEGRLRMTPKDRDDLHLLYGDELAQLQDKMMEYAHKYMDDGMGDVFDAILIKWAEQAKTQNDYIDVTIADVAQYRGLQERLDEFGRKRGFHDFHKKNIADRIFVLGNVWIEVQRAEAYIIENGKKKKTTLTADGHLIEIQYIYSMETEEKREVVGYSVRPNKLIAHGILGGGKKTVLLHKAALHLDPKRLWLEKRLLRYLAFLWGNRRKNANYSEGIYVKTLLERIGLDLDERQPSRTKTRLTAALDFLLQQKHINAWDYEGWNEDSAPKKQWAPQWLHSKITIEPPDVIKEYYREHVQIPSVPSVEELQKAPGKKDTPGQYDIATLLKETRKQKGLSLSQTADLFNVSKAYLSAIENGRKKPSKRLVNQLLDWVNQKG